MPDEPAQTVRDQTEAPAKGGPPVEEMGPVDYLMIEFPRQTVTGEGMRELVKLVDQHIVRVLDLVFLRRGEDGAVSRVPLAALDTAAGPSDESFDLEIFAGATSGLLDEDDVHAAGELVQAGNAAAILVYENLWAAPLAAILRRRGAELVAGGRIPLADLQTALDASEPGAAPPPILPTARHEAAAPASATREVRS